MKQDAWFIGEHGQSCVEYDVDQKRIMELRCQFGEVFPTRPLLRAYVERKKEQSAVNWVQSHKLTDKERKAVLKEQWKYAMEHLTEEDKAIVRESREQRKSIYLIQREFAMSMM